MAYGRIPTNLSGLGRQPVFAVGPGPQTHRKEVPKLRDYEVLYIVRADLDDEKVQDAVKRVNRLIEGAGGTADATNLWGKRKLAYEVKHQKEGAYVLQDFQLDPDRVPELESSLKITEEVLRHLIVRKPEKPAPTPVAPPPAVVVVEPVTSEAEAVAGGVRPANAEEET
jgi:small subunit ribosomal protein S6